MQGALYLLLVPAHRATDDEAEEVLYRWLDALQARAPGAAVQLVLSQCDQLPALQAQLATAESHPVEGALESAEGALESLLEASPDALAIAAAPQLEWLRAKWQAYAERTAALATAQGKQPPSLLRVQASIPCVCAAEGGDTSLVALREYLFKLLCEHPPLLPSIGYQVPNSWVAALALPIALREGRTLSTLSTLSTLGSMRLPAAASESPSVAAVTTAAADGAARASVKRPYVLLSELHSIWREIAPHAVPDEADPSSILTDALQLLCNQGEVFMSTGMVFLDPDFATELLRPLVDHQLTSAANFKADVEKYVSATPGLANEAGLAGQLLDAIDEFVARGLLSPRLLPFFWRATALAPSDYEAAKRMLIEAAILIELLTVDAGSSHSLLMPMRMPTERPAIVEAQWPSGGMPHSGGTQIGVRFDLSGARLPPGVIERCVGCVSIVKGYRLLECWRHGALLTNASQAGDLKGATGTDAGTEGTALLELTSTALKVEARGNANMDAQVVQQALTPLVDAVEHVLGEYPGFLYNRTST